MKRFLLAVITEGDLCVAHFCNALVQSIKLGGIDGVEFFPVFFPASGNWSMGFNNAVTLAWKEKLDGLVVINPFVAWDPGDLIKFVNTDKDAVGFPVATKTGFDISLGEISRLQEDEETGEIKVMGCSLDLFYLSSYAIERLCQSHPTVKYRGVEVKLIIQSGDIYDSYFNPSDILAYRLREQGIEVWLAAKYTAHRQDYAEYSSNFEEALKNLKENG